MRCLQSQHNHMVYQLYVLDAIIRNEKSSHEEMLRALVLKPIIMNKVKEIRKQL